MSQAHPETVAKGVLRERKVSLVHPALLVPLAYLVVLDSKEKKASPDLLG